ncbi:MAG: extracellular solute-binding protein [Clostridiales bacterium]|nr:extracellular solute-binding protein [Clostridiales bacterium]
MLILMALVFSSCAKKIKKDTDQKTASPVTLVFATFLDDGEQVEAYRDIIKNFEDKNKDIKVDLVFGGTGYYQKISDAFVNNKKVDIVGLKRNKMIEYAKMGYIKDLTQWVDKNDFKDKYYGVNLGYGKLNAKYYGIGDLPYTNEWFYNVDLFEKYGIGQPGTLDEFIDTCKTLKKYVKDPIAAGTKDPWVANILFGMISVQTVNTDELSNAFADNDREAFLSLSGAQDAVNTYYDLKKAGSANYKANNYDYSTSVDNFVNGKAAIFPMGSWAIDKIEKVKSQEFKYDVFENAINFAQNPISKVAATAVQVITVNQKTKHINEVMKFMDFLFSEESQSIFAEKNGISGLKTVNKADTPVKKNIIDHLNQTDENSTMYIDNISDAMMNVTADRLSQMMSGKIKIEDTWNIIAQESSVK